MLVRLLQPAEVGEWILFTSIGGILETLRNGFIRNPFISRLVVAKEEDRENIIRSSLYLHIIIAIGISLLIFIFAKPLANFWRVSELEGLFYVYGLNTIALVIYLHFEYLLQSKLVFKGIFISTVIRLSILFIYLFIHYIFGRTPSLLSLAVVQLLAIFIGSFSLYQFVRLFFSPINWSLREVSFMRELFHFGKYTFGTNISSMVIKSTDSWMIGRLISSEGVALYNPAIRIANIVEVPTLAIANMVFPQVGKSWKELGNEGIQSIYYRSVGLILAVMLPIVFPLYVFAEQIIILLFGNAYISAVPILKVTVFYTLIIPFNRQFGTIMDALKMPKLNFYLLLIVAILNILLNYLLLGQIGVIGAAYSTLFAYVFVFLANQVILFYKFKIRTIVVFIEMFNWYMLGWKFIKKRIKI